MHMGTFQSQQQQSVDLESLSFDERMQLGADNALLCMGVSAQDRVFILTITHVKILLAWWPLVHWRATQM